MNFIHLYDKHIAEFITFPKSEEEITIGDKKYYKNKKLTEKTKDVVRKYADADVKDIILKLIDDGLLTPVFIDKNISQYIINFVIEKHRNHLLGIATYLDKNGYVFINPKLFFVNEKEIYLTITHELIHVADYRQSEKFYSVNTPILSKFYKLLFSRIFSIKPSAIKNEDIIYLIKELKKTDKKHALNLNIYYKIFDKIKNSSSLKEQEFDYKSNELINFIHASWYDFDNLLRAPKNISNSFKDTYSDITGAANKEIRSWFCQEFWTPTEVIAMIATIRPNNSFVKKTIKLLK
jgi:predicted SprT family Zn-dependent metalloprotease